MITIKFYLKNPKDLNNTILVRLRGGRKFDFTAATKESVNLQDWNASAGQCITSIRTWKDGKQIESRSVESRERVRNNELTNYNLSTLRNRIESAYKNISDKDVSRRWLDSIINPENYVTEEVKEPNLIEYAQQYLEEKRKDFKRGLVTESTIKKTVSVIHILERLIASKGINPPKLTEIDRGFQRLYEDYCTEVETYKPNYTNPTFKAIKTICYNAAANGLKINEGIRYLKIKLERSKFITLNFEELEAIGNYHFNEEHLDNARDWLIIGAFSGQRCSDLLRFETSMVESEEVDGQTTHFVCFTQQKTGRQLRLALHYKVVEILEKRNWNFPRKISDQRFNEYIKVVAEKAGLDEPTEGSISQRDKNGRIRKIDGIYPKHQLVTSHICRRSFCTNFYGLIDTPTLMLASGHTTEKQFREYIHDVDRKQANRFAIEMNKINTVKMK